MSRPRLWMMVGIPGSGKSAMAERIKLEHPHTAIVSSDEIRQRLYGDVNDQDHNAEVFAEMHKTVTESLKVGLNVIYDATNINSKRRTSFLNSISDISCYKEAIIMAIPFEICLRRNWSRERKIPDKVIIRMYKSWQTPARWEGWDDIETVCYKDREFRSELMKHHIEAFQYFNYDQNNPWNSKTLGKHILDAGEYIFKHSPDNYDLITAALHHDIGKAFCKTTDDNGISHYYGHENVGAYDMLAFGEKLNVCLLINYHMRPLSWEGSDNPQFVRDKYKKLWGEVFFNDIMLLHEADKASA